MTQETLWRVVEPDSDDVNMIATAKNICRVYGLHAAQEDLIDAGDKAGHNNLTVYGRGAAQTILLRRHATNPDECNGWHNAETWVLGLYLDNERAVYDAVKDIGKQADSDHEAGQLIKSAIEDDDILGMGDLAENGFLRDLVNTALDRIDWDQVGGHVREE